MALLIQGCASFPFWSYGPDGQSREAFERRVEAAFRLQNHMTSEVMILQESGLAPNDKEAILDAEQKMQKNCAYLNEYASREIDGLNTGLILLNQVESSVLECETAAHRLEQLIKMR